jgi:thiol-disulfide isomerase/thioredoxin
MAAVWEWRDALEQNVTQAAISTSPSDPATPAKTPAPETANVTERLAGLPLTRLDGGVDRLALYSGKTLVLNVWATWCPPCREELPALQRLSERLDPNRFAVAGLSIDTDPDFVREYLRDVGVSYVNYIDVAKDVTGTVAGLESVPQTLVIGPDGTLRIRIEGFRDWDDPQIVAQLEGRE